MRLLSNLVVAAVSFLILSGCGTSRASVPSDSAALPKFSFAALAGSPVTLRVVDHRADPARSTEWTARVRSDVEGALRAAGVTVGDSPDNVFEVRINNARADFELGNWNGCAKLTGDIVRSGRRVTGTGEKCVKKGNLWGYKTADDVTTMAYRDALSELLSNLDAQLR